LLLTTSPAAGREPSSEWLPQAEDPAALVELGKRYFYGVRAPQNLDKAVQLFCAAAKAGSAEASFRLGDIYARSLGGKKDEVLAAAWLTKAALAKYQAAKPRLARWDLSGADLTGEAACVSSGEMVSRRLPRVRRAAAPTPKKAAPAPVKVPRKIARNPRQREIERLVRELAPEFKLDPELVLAVIKVESNFNAKAQSPKQAQGLMQLIPATARRFGVSDPWDPQQNLRGGMTYLRWLIDHFDGDVRLALAGYNAGEGAVKRYGGVPPYKETRNYVRKIAKVLGVSEDGLGAVGFRSAENRPAEERSAVFTKVREADAKRDWESRFFDMGASG
jgi:soluble lytic murein transglycosylase-like protein